MVRCNAHYSSCTGRHILAKEVATSWVLRVGRIVQSNVSPAAAPPRGRACQDFFLPIVYQPVAWRLCIDVESRGGRLVLAPPVLGRDSGGPSPLGEVTRVAISDLTEGYTP